MKNFLKSTIIVLGAAFAITSFGSLEAAPVVYEPFNYSVGNLHGQSNSSSFGFSAAWDAKVDGTYSTLITADSLYGAYSSLGGKVGPLSVSTNRYGGSRAISSSALSGSGLLNDGATLWMSVVMGYGSGANLTNARLAVALANDNFSSANYDYWIKDAGSQAGEGLGVVLGRFSSTNGRAVPVKFRNLAAGDDVAGNINGTWTGAGTALGANQYALYVLKFTWGATSSDPDSVEVYKPNGNLTLGSPISTLSNIYVNQSAFDTITFARGDVVTLDEIRLGATYADVAPAASGPVITAKTPSSNDGFLPLQATFDSNITAGQGDIRIYNSNGPALLSTISVTDTSKVTINGKVMTITPAESFTIGQSYYVEMDAGTVKDPANNYSAGFVGSSTWSFAISALSYPNGDPDGDGLTNATEKSLGTNPSVADSDGDGLSDGYEYSHQYNPLLADTDGDGYNDGAEVTAGSNPLVAASKPGDIDADGLPDTWETANFGNLSHNGTADTDGDGLSDALEFSLGLNPNDPDTDHDGNPDWMGLPGYFYVEQWNSVPGTSLQEMFASSVFRGTPNDTMLVTQAKVKQQGGADDNNGVRMRGRVIAPVTGQYHFWIAGDGPSKLYLSTDSTAFKRRQVAAVKTASGEDQFDLDPSQKSAAINLVAGQEYYIEGLMKDGAGSYHLSLAWDYLGQLRQIIPGAQIRSYITDTGDADGDGMLDSWETSVGLNPNNNGGTESNQSAYADPDADGLLNFEEYNNSGNPFVAGGNQGYLELSVWNGITGISVKDLTGSSKFTSTPDRKDLSGADISGLGLNYGARLRGTITAPQTGDYVFYVSGDEQAELWISSNNTCFAKRKIAYSTTKTNYQQWTTGTRQSVGVHLQQGTSYYIEALVKNASGTDHLSIGWSRIAESEWQVSNIGSTTSPSWSVNSASGNIHGSLTGGEIRYGSDNFTFRNLQLQGDGELVARIPNMDSTNPLAKAGLMFRESLAANSTFAMIFFQSNRKINMYHRDTNGAQTVGTGGTASEQPYQWLKISRAGNVFTGYYSLDGLTWKSSGTCTIAMGQTVYVGMATASGANNVPVTADWDHVGFTDLSRVAVIPSSALASFSPSALDLDDDNLPDAWETANGLSASNAGSGMGQYGDLDGDHVSNYDEYLLDSNPFGYGDIAGNLMRELWPSLLGDTFHDVVTSTPFLQGSPQFSLLTAAEQITLGNTSGVQRVRGTVTAPVTGDYRFWISGYSDCELWLNTSGSSKFGKRKLAWLYENFPGGPYDVGFRQWEGFASQCSQTVHLVAGQRYFMEILQMQSQGSGNFSVAWDYTDSNGQNTPRDLIPPSQLHSFKADPDDADDDYLPDSWETAMGLNAADNGFIDRDREGEYGDFDNDGLTNREEYLLGTDPTKADTDYDGSSDLVEAHDFGSDPKISGSSLGTVIASMTGSTGSPVFGQWAAGMDGSLLSLDRQGTCTWPFTLPQSGIKILEVMAKTQGNQWAGDTMYLDIAVLRASDSKRWTVGTFPLDDNFGNPCQVLAILPQLAAGSYLVEISSHNVAETRSVRIDSIRILEAAGTDSDANGNADWLDNRLSRYNNVLTGNTSAVSPACVEGIARDISMSWLQSGSDTINLMAGIDNRWFANVNLPSDGTASPISANFEDGTFSVPSPISWTATNVIAGGSITVRSGDSLRLTAYPGSTADGSPVTIDGVGDQITTTADAPVVRSFVMTDWALASNGSVATQSSTDYNAPASRAIDGKVNGVLAGASVSHTANSANSWLQVDFGRTRDVANVVLWNRTDSGMSRLSNFRISLQDSSGNEVIGQNFYPSGGGNAGVSMTWTLPQTVQANRLRVSLLGLNNAGDGFLALAEVQAFPPKTLTLNATHTDSNGTVSTGSMTVNVVSADFGDSLPLRSGRWCDWSLPGVAFPLPLEFDSNIRATEIGPDQGGHKLRVTTASTKPVRLVARTAAGSSIVGVGTVEPYQIGDVYDSGYVEDLDTLPDGTIYGRISLVADRLPPGGYIQIQIWAGGAQFADGTGLKNLYAADFGPDGIAYVDVYYPSTVALSSFCHYTRLYSANGTLLSGY